MKTNLTATELRKLISYNPETGDMFWLGGPRLGKAAGCVSPTTRYIHIKLNQHQYLAHRLAWLHQYGCWPNAEIDHRDLCRSNNAIANLREATPSQNRTNTGLRSTNTTGFKGVSFNKPSKKYRADIRIKGRRTTLGYFDNALDASRCYEAAAFVAHGEFRPAAAREILLGEVK